MRSLVPSSLAAFFTTSREARESDDGSALLHANTAESPPIHDDREEDSDVVVSISEQADEQQAVPGSSISPPQSPAKPGNSTTDAPSSDVEDPQLVSTRTDSSVNCLICLDPIDPLDTRNVVTLGCSCKGPSALRHKSCLDQWLTVKGDTLCDVCGAEMNVPLPPPPPVRFFFTSVPHLDDISGNCAPVKQHTRLHPPQRTSWHCCVFTMRSLQIPGFVVFPELEHTFEVQWGTFSRYLWHNAVAVIVYCFVLALIMDIPLHIALLIALVVLVMIVLRYVVSVGINTIARRTILSFQVPDTA